MSVVLDKKKFDRHVKALTDRSYNVIFFFKKITLNQYKSFQLKRWQTENESEGQRWKPLDPEYAKRKRKLFKNYPKAGKAMLIATSNLFENTVRSPFVVAEKRKITIGVEEKKVPYASFVNKERLFMKFSKNSVDKFKQSLFIYLKTGKLSK